MPNKGSVSLQLCHNRNTRMEPEGTLTTRRQTLRDFVHQRIRRASAQGVSDHQGRSPLDNASTLFIFRFVFETFAIEANSNSHFRSIFRNQGSEHEFEQYFELELLFLV